MVDLLALRGDEGCFLGYYTVVVYIGLDLMIMSFMGFSSTCIVRWCLPAYSSDSFTFSDGV